MAALKHSLLAIHEVENTIFDPRGSSLTTHATWSPYIQLWNPRKKYFQPLQGPCQILTLLSLTHRGNFLIVVVRHDMLIPLTLKENNYKCETVFVDWLFEDRLSLEESHDHNND